MQELSANLKDALEIAKKLDIEIILDGGSLLGAYRDKGVIKGDEDDIDFAVPMEAMNFKALQILREFEARGFELFRLRDTVMTFKRHGSKIDFLFYRAVVGSYFLTLYHNKKPFALIVPKEHWNNLGTISFLGEKCLCPKDVELYLRWRFGKKWKTPILRPKFTFKNYLESENKYLTCWL